MKCRSGFALAAFAAFVAVAMFSVPAIGQPTQPGQPIEGEVVDRITGVPLAGAYVTPNCGPMPAAVTDAYGRFHLAPAGSAGSCGSLRVSRAGYVARYDYFFNPAANETPALRILLTPQSVISGRVVDEDGFPIADARIAVLSSQMVNGARKLLHVPYWTGTLTSDDQGEYRLAGLLPGRYYLAVWTAGSASQWDSRYVPQFYPSAAAPDDAAPIEVKPGQQRTGVTIHLSRKEGVTVSGRVTLPAGVSTRPPGFFLQGIDNFAFRDPATLQPDGSFIVPHVLPGSYVLRTGFGSESFDVRGALDITVGSSDLSGLTFAYHKAEARDISGHVNIPPGLPAAPEKVSLRMRDGRVISTPIDSSGNFVFRSLAPANYGVHVMVSAADARRGPSEIASAVSIAGKPISMSSWEMWDFDGSLSGPFQIDLEPWEPTVRVSVKAAGASGVPLAGEALVFVRSGEQYGSVVNLDELGAQNSVPLSPGDYRVYHDEFGLGRFAATDADFLEAHANDFPPVHINAGSNPPLVLTRRQ